MMERACNYITRKEKTRKIGSSVKQKQQRAKERDTWRVVIETVSTEPCKNNGVSDEKLLNEKKNIFT